MKLIDNLIVTLGTLLVLLAIAIASIGFTWHLVKPLVEKTEVKLLDANVSELYHLNKEL